MKKRVLSLSLLALLCLAVGLSAAPAPSDEPAATETEAVPAPEINAPAPDQAPPVCEAGTSEMLPIHYCGDPCSPEGWETICRSSSLSNPLSRIVICTCISGHLEC